MNYEFECELLVAKDHYNAIWNNDYKSEEPCTVAAATLREFTGNQSWISYYEKKEQEKCNNISGIITIGNDDSRASFVKKGFPLTGAVKITELEEINLEEILRERGIIIKEITLKKRFEN